MTITVDYIRRNFDEFNMLVFGGVLKTPPFRVSRARTFLGMVKCKRKRMLLSKWHFYDFEFVISSKVNLLKDENEVEDVILHEMIHYYILSNQLQDSSAHGVLFRKMMKDINTKFNRNITISRKIDLAAR